MSNKIFKFTLTRKAKKALFGYVFVSPFLIGFLGIYIQVFIDSIKYSFSELTMVNNKLFLQNIGLTHYNFAFFIDPDFSASLLSSVQKMLFDIPVILIFSLFFASILNQKMKGRTFFRAMLFVPVILVTGLIEKVDLNNLTNLFGSLNTTIASGAGTSLSDSLGNLSIISYLKSMAILPSVVSFVESLINGIFGIVTKSGVQILLFLAGLQSVSPSIYESAKIEGASGWELYWKINVPMLMPIIIANGVYTVIDSFTRPDNICMRIIENYAVNKSKFGLAAAMSWSYTTVIMVTLGVLAIIAYGSYKRGERS